MKLWDLEQNIALSTLSGHTDSVFCCAISDNCNTIVSTSSDNTLRIWDGINGAELYKIETGRIRSYNCSVSGDGSLIANSGPGLKKEGYYRSIDRVFHIWKLKSF